MLALGGEVEAVRVRLRLRLEGGQGGGGGWDGEEGGGTGDVRCFLGFGDEDCGVEVEVGEEDVTELTRSQLDHHRDVKHPAYGSESKWDLGQRIQSYHPHCHIVEHRREPWCPSEIFTDLWRSAHCTFPLQMHAKAHLIRHIPAIHEIPANSHRNVNDHRDSIGGLAHPVSLFGVAHVPDEIGDEAVSAELNVSCCFSGADLDVQRLKSAAQLTPETRRPMATSAFAAPCAGQRSVGAGSRREPGDVGLAV